jgi:membrane-bound lytic murein transglycosylase D
MEEEGKTLWSQPLVPVRVRIEGGIAPQSDLLFTETFRIGRDKSCGVRMKEPSVSKFHSEIRFDGESWWVHDLESTNGTYLDGVRIERAPLPSEGRVELGRGGPILRLAIEGIKPVERKEEASAGTAEGQGSATQFIERYLTSSPAGKAGEHTLMVRRAFERIRKKQSKRYMLVIGVTLVLLGAVGGVAVYQQRRLQHVRGVAENIFYTMKALELQVAQAETMALSSSDTKQLSEMEAKRARFKEMEQNYDQFVEEIGFFGKKMGKDEKIIFRMARLFGECEIDIPDGFVKEVRGYIGKWKTTDRLEKAIKHAKRSGYVQKIVDQLLARHLPPQFFYLALKESGFDERTVGPETRYGIAKGIWQFIPATAVQYGLRTGPLVELRRYDPRDDRYDFEKATRAASMYLMDLYNTEAQASGLLVIASYNWGENNILPIVRKMPENPRERNFWHLLKEHKIPRETYDYVLYIFSAAVIGENPRLFGFDFENPLGSVKGIAQASN